MILPIGTDRPLRRTPVVVRTLVVLNVLVFLYSTYLGSQGGDALRAFESRFWVIGGEYFTLHGLVTSAFLHGGFMHLLGNMLFLYAMGPNVEDRFGRIGFTLFYLAACAASGGAHAVFENAPAIGASGAVAAVTGAYLVLFPRTNIRVIIILFLMGGFMLPAWWLIGFQIAWNLLAQITGRADGIAYLAHLAGYGCGIGVAFVLLRTRILSREPYDLFTILNQAKRRAEIRASVESAARERERQLAAPPTPESEALAAARADVTQAMGRGDWAAASDAYSRLLDRADGEASRVVFSRRAQFELANRLASDGARSLAERAYEGFVSEYPTDVEAPLAQVMLARLYAESPDRAGEARALLERAIPRLDDPELRAIAEEDLGALPEAPVLEERP